MYRYLPVKEVCHSPEVPEYVSFGIGALQEQGGAWSQVLQVSDVSVHSEEVDALAQRCTIAQLEPVHLRAVVADLIGA